MKINRSEFLCNWRRHRRSGGCVGAAASHGAQVSLLEQAPALTEVGAGLQISENGMCVYCVRLGWRICLPARSRTVRSCAITAKGALSAGCPVPSAGPTYYFHRADLLNLLHSAARKAGVDVRLGAKVSNRCRNTPTKPKSCLASGEAAARRMRRSPPTVGAARSARSLNGPEDTRIHPSGRLARHHPLATGFRRGDGIPDHGAGSACRDLPFARSKHDEHRCGRRALGLAGRGLAKLKGDPDDLRARFSGFRRSGT